MRYNQSYQQCVCLFVFEWFDLTAASSLVWDCLVGHNNAPEARTRPPNQSDPLPSGTISCQHSITPVRRYGTR